MKAVVNRDLCIGCSLCAEICPEVFVMSDDMIAQVVADPVPPALEDQARDAASSCPVEAISLSEE
jgi:ferredoxin